MNVDPILTIDHNNMNSYIDLTLTVESMKQKSNVKGIADQQISGSYNRNNCCTVPADEKSKKEQHGIVKKI